MNVVDLYLSLLVGGIVCFVLYYMAQWRIARLLRQQHPQQWAIIAGTEAAGAQGFRIWLRLQQVLRNARPRLPELLQDSAITRWYRIWRGAPWLAWLCWFGALFVQWRAH